MLNYDNTAKMYTMSIDDFYSWKAGLYGKNNQVTIGTIPITIE